MQESLQISDVVDLTILIQLGRQDAGLLKLIDPAQFLLSLHLLENLLQTLSLLEFSAISLDFDHDDLLLRDSGATSR